MFSAQRRARSTWNVVFSGSSSHRAESGWRLLSLDACTCHADVAFLVDVRGGLAERHGTPARSRECDNGQCGVKFLQAPKCSELWHFCLLEKRSMLPPARPCHWWETTGRGRPRGVMAAPGRVRAAPRCVKATNWSSVLNNRCGRHMFSVTGALSA